MIDMSILKFSTSRPHNLLTIHKRKQINKVYSFAVSRFATNRPTSIHTIFTHVHVISHMQVVHSKSFFFSTTECMHTLTHCHFIWTRVRVFNLSHERIQFWDFVFFSIFFSPFNVYNCHETIHVVNWNAWLHLVQRTH